MFSGILSRRKFALALGAFLSFFGCMDYFERQELEKRLNELLGRRAQLQQAYDRETKGKTVYTEAEKDRIGPIYIQLQQVDQEIANVQSQIRELD